MAEQIYIDTVTGTWGESKELVLVEVSPEDLDYLAEASDSQITDFGRGQGEPVISVYEVASWLKNISADLRDTFLAEFDPEPEA